MKKLFALALLAILALSTSLFAQTRFEGGNVYGGLNIQSGDVALTGFTLAGEGYLAKHVSAAAELSTGWGSETSGGYKINYNRVNFNVGPRVFLRSGDFRPYAHLMFGVSHFGASVDNGGGDASSNNFLTVFGAGIDYKIGKRYDWRLQLDAMHAANSTKARFTTGVAYRF